MAVRVGRPQAIARCTLARGIAALFAGEFRTAHECCERALTILRNECVSTTWELSCAYLFSLGALLTQGELREISRELPGLLAIARERGNLYLETELRTRLHVMWLRERTTERPDSTDSPVTGIRRERGDAEDAVRLAAEGAAQGTRARQQAAIDDCAVCRRALVPCAVGLLCRPTSRTALNNVESSDSSAPLRSLPEP